MRVITFENLGYSSVEAPQFVKAEDDVRKGLDTQGKQVLLLEQEVNGTSASQRQ